jgi:TPR repeat protein
VALLEKAAGQGHAYAMYVLATIHVTREGYEQAVAWFTKGAEAGLPKAMFELGLCLDQGVGVAAPDYPAAAGWYRRAADAGHASGRGLHSFTSQLNLSAFHGIGGARRGCVARVKGVLGGAQGV